MKLTSSLDRPSFSATLLCQVMILIALGMTMTGCVTGGGAGDSLTLFDGETLTGWAESDFAGNGEITIKDGTLIIGTGFMTGITYTNSPYPKIDYEISLDAMRVDGTDFFCGLTFPVGEASCSFVVGGWGGGVVGLSNIDGEDAANNDTTKYMGFDSGRWYALRVRVTASNISAWIDDEQVVDQDLANREVSIRIEMEPCVPIGVATYATTGALRNFKISRL